MANIPDTDIVRQLPVNSFAYCHHSDSINTSKISSQPTELKMSTDRGNKACLFPHSNSKTLFIHITYKVRPEMPLMFGGKIGKQKIYISAINGPSLPPKLLENRCRAFCCVATPCHSCLGEKRKIEKYVFPSSMALHCPPNPLKLSNPLQTVTSSIDKSRHGKNVSVNRSSSYRPPHLHCQMEFGTNLTPLNRLQCRR